MADIELVIKIPEELKNKIDNANEDSYKAYLWWFDTTLCYAIKDGTPLPKGHGDLIDKNKLLYKLKNSYLDTFGTERVMSVLSELPIIIKADKGETE